MDIWSYEDSEWFLFFIWGWGVFDLNVFFGMGENVKILF